MNSGGNIVICHEFDWTKYFESKLPSSKGLRNKYDCAYYFGNRKSWFWDWEYLVESLGKQILDKACTKTISSEKWINEYIENLNEEDKKLFVVKKKVNLCLDLGVVQKVKLYIDLVGGV